MCNDGGFFAANEHESTVAEIELEGSEKVLAGEILEELRQLVRREALLHFALVHPG
jgi:hypothetical protein